MPMRALSAGLPEPAFLRLMLSERALDREGRPRCAFSVVFLRHRITEQRHQPIAQLFGDVAAHLRHCGRGGIQIRADQIAPVLGIKPRRDASRTNKIAEHHRDMSALANGFCDGRGSRRRSRWSSGCCRDGWSLHARVVTQSSDSIEQLTAVSDGCDAELLQVLVPSGSAGPSRLSHSRGKRPRTAQGQGSAASLPRP